ncbi:hypothetical protein [Halorhabdus sp. BNX81]|uniref:hypothetical protein n=1 Tax=Halorhabdus sp. BNX81 TaxID=2980181 RepID=UPI0023DD5911|nr:hypothetical protein [Halorhabdus sp. BNX81]
MSFQGSIEEIFIVQLSRNFVEFGLEIGDFQGTFVSLLFWGLFAPGSGFRIKPREQSLVSGSTLETIDSRTKRFFVGTASENRVSGPRTRIVALAELENLSVRDPIVDHGREIVD